MTLLKRRVPLDVTAGNRYATTFYVRHGFLESGNGAADPPNERSECRFVKNLALQ